MKNVLVRKSLLDPRDGHNADLEAQFEWRKTGRFIGESVVDICDAQIPIWWNRPLDSDTLIKIEEDGLYSYNLPFLGGRDIYKTGYNLLLAKNSIPFSSHILFDNTWTEEQRQTTYDFSYNVIWDSLVELGVDPEKMARPRNDITYEGKKFVGGEKKIIGDVFSEDLVITLQFLPEKDIFDRLTGKYAHTRKITGIEEEVPTVTKMALIDKLYEKTVEFFSNL